MNKPKSPLPLEEILTDYSKEEDLLEVPLENRVFRIFFFVMAVLILIVAGKLFELGIVHHSFYASRAFANMSEVKVQTAPRGVIRDRFGDLMVWNESTFNVFLVPALLPEGEYERAQSIQEISIATNIPRDELLKLVAKKKNWALEENIFLTNNLSQEQLVTVVSRPLAGIRIESAFKRVSAEPFAFSHLLGYTGFVQLEDIAQNPQLHLNDAIGKAGIEAFYDSYLRGVNGKTVILRDAKGVAREERITQSPQKGSDLHTFIDGPFQRFFYERLTRALSALGSRSGVGIAMNPQNGEVLALVSMPSFDVTNVANYLEREDHPLFNRAIGGLYNPGSTIKPLVALGALVEGIITPFTRIFSAGYIEVPNPYHPREVSRFVDWKPHGWVDLYSALARSSNIYFYEVGGGFGAQRGLGITKLRTWWERFGLGEKTGIDLPGEEEGFLPSPEWKEKKTGEPWRLGDTYNTSIGQGDLIVTPIEILNYVSAIANGGTFYVPRVADAAYKDGKKVFEREMKIRAELDAASREQIIEIQRGMRDAVKESYGTAHLLADLPFSVAAKTGTAQVENNKKTNAFFVGYAPFDHPEIAILVLIENSLEGSLNAVPVARDLFLWYYENRMKP